MKISKVSHGINEDYENAVQTAYHLWPLYVGKKTCSFIVLSPAEPVIFDSTVICFYRVEMQRIEHPPQQTKQINDNERCIIMRKLPTPANRVLD